MPRATVWPGERSQYSVDYPTPTRQPDILGRNGTYVGFRKYQENQSSFRIYSVIRFTDSISTCYGADSEVAAARLFRCSFRVRVEKKLAHLAGHIAGDGTL